MQRYDDEMFYSFLAVYGRLHLSQHLERQQVTGLEICAIGGKRVRAPAYAFARHIRVMLRASISTTEMRLAAEIVLRHM